VPDLTYLFEKIENEEQWFPQIPDDYLSQLGIATAGQNLQVQAPEGMAQQVGVNVHPSLGVAPEDDGAQSIVRNDSYNAAFDRYKNLNIPISTIFSLPQG